MTERTRIVLVAGARPNFMKVAPIIRELRSHEEIFDWRLVHTGQHYDHGMSDVFFKELGIPEPHFHMGSGGGGHAEQTARIMVSFEKYCESISPSLVILFGDVNSTLACAIVAKKLSIAVAHVEAGLRSGDKRMPEEINRIVTDSISDLFFVTEQSGVANLKREGHRDDQVFFVGHVMIDNLFYQIRQLAEVDTSKFVSNKIIKNLGHYGVVTLHRPSNVDSKSTLTEILDALTEISNKLPLVFAVHPRTAANIERFDIKVPPSIQCTEPLPYMDFLNLWRQAEVVLTDSGGLQEETTALGVRCITLRENTERPITVNNGTNVLAGSSKSGILRAFDVSMNALNKRKAAPEFWDGHASKRIVQELIKFDMGIRSECR